SIRGRAAARPSPSRDRGRRRTSRGRSRGSSAGRGARRSVRRPSLPRSPQIPEVARDVGIARIETGRDLHLTNAAHEVAAVRKRGGQDVVRLPRLGRSERDGPLGAACGVGPPAPEEADPGEALPCVGLERLETDRLLVLATGVLVAADLREDVADRLPRLEEVAAHARRRGERRPRAVFVAPRVERLRPPPLVERDDRAARLVAGPLRPPPPARTPV